MYFCGCRGKFRSKPWQQLLDEAKYLVESGVKELNLIAEDTNQYGQDRKDGLCSVTDKMRCSLDTGQGDLPTSSSRNAASKNVRLAVA